MNADRLLIVSLVVCGCSGFSGDWHPAGRGGAGGTDDETSGGAGESGSGSGGAAGTSGGSAGAGAGAGTGAGGTSTGGKGGTGSSGGNGGVGGATGGVGGSTGGIGGATGGVGGTTGGVGGSGATGGATGGTAGSTGGTLDAGTIVDAGKGGTGGTVPTCDAQSGTATPVPEAPAQCTSGKKWTSGNGPTMSPGDICQGCHGFSIAGTVYPTIHETGLCNGVNGGAQVVITPSCGAPITLTVNNVGNFYYTGTVRQPFTAKVIVNGVERAMVTPQTLGDCNACHTQNGLQGAPGRIIVP